jgi:hypothetical protein
MFSLRRAPKLRVNRLALLRPKLRILGAIFAVGLLIQIPFSTNNKLANKVFSSFELLELLEIESLLHRGGSMSVSCSS